MQISADEREDATSPAPHERGAHGWVSSLAAVTGAAAVPYGFTLVISGTVLMLVRHSGTPDDGEVFAFCIAAVVGFAMMGALGTRHTPPAPHPAAHRQLIVTGVTNVLAVACCLAEAALSSLLPALLAWPLAAVCVVATYLGIVAAQHSLSGRAMY